MIKKYRCISLWEPWATLIACGVKTIETRGKPTKIRGDVVICAAAKQNEEITQYVLRYRRENVLPWNENPSYGHAVAIAEITDCRPLTTADLQAAAILGAGAGQLTQADLAGRYAWCLGNIRRIKMPVPVKGSQGFFFRDLNLDDLITTELSRKKGR